MSETAIIPIEQREVAFEDNLIPAVLVPQSDGGRVVGVPLRPICDHLGVGWSGQRKRLSRDPVLSKIAMSVVVTSTDIGTTSRRPRTSVMLCLPLEYLNGWLFGIHPDRVKPAIRDRVIRYQQDCYKVLAAAFLEKPDAASSSPHAAALVQIREMGRAIMTMAEEQLRFEERLITHDQRLDKAAAAFSDLNKRVILIERKIAPGNPVNEEQASQLSQAVKTVALELGKRSGRNEFGAVYGEMYRRFGITGYKFLPASQFAEAIAWLTQWHNTLSSSPA